jgi:hypothetical protein
VALKSDAAAEKPEDQLSRDFLGSIFDFCNNIGQYQNSQTLFNHRIYEGQQCRWDVKAESLGSLEVHY